MEPTKTIKAIAAPLPIDNLDTDQIYPKQFLRTIRRTGLGTHAFHDMRYLEDGSDNPDFVLNRPEYKSAGVLISGENFGSGSSREHAPWAMKDMGIKCVIAPTFADIFANNSFKNGLLLIELPKEDIRQLMEEAQNNPGGEIEVDLEKQTITRGNKFSFSFEMDPFRKECLLNGWDDISLTLEKKAHISAYEERRKKERPWL